MHCVQCGRTLDAGARFCGNCGEPTGQSSNRTVPLAPSQARDNPLAKMSGCSFLLLMIVIIAVLSQLPMQGQNVNPAAPAESAATIARRAKGCDQAVATLQRTGVLRGSVTATAVQVDEILWAELPADQKRIFAAGMRCAARRGDRGGAADVMLIEGYHNGQVLASVGPGGATLN